MSAVTVTDATKPITLGSASLATLCAVLWGGLAVAIQFTQDSLPPLGTAGLRFALAAVVVWGWARYQGYPLSPLRGDLWPIGTISVLLFIQIGSFHWGLTRTSSSHGSVLIGAHPVLVAALAHFLLRGDRLSLRKGIGLAVCVAGLVGVVGSARKEQAAAAVQDVATLLGDFVVLGSSMLLAVKTVYTKHAVASTSVAKLIFWSNGIAAALFLAVSLAREDLLSHQLSAAALAGLLYQGLAVAGFCFLAWTALLQHHRASQLAVFTFAQPLSGILFGALFRGDNLTWALGLGALAVGCGVYLVARASQ